MPRYDRKVLCSHLRSKNMYTDPDPQAEGNAESSLTENFWCNLTMKNLGPDERLCDSDSCKKGRWCYRSVFDVT